MKFYKRFPGDIMKKTSGLTMAQFGAYDRLIDWCYANEKPVDPDEVYTIAHAQTPADRRDVDKVLAKFFTRSADGYRQERIEEVIADALPRIAAARANGKKGGRPVTHTKPSGFVDGTHHEPDAKASQSQTFSPTEKKAPRKRDAATAIECPANVSPQVWGDWLTLRAKKRAPVTSTVIASAIGEAGRAGMTLEAFLTVWCARGSQGLQAEWLKPNERAGAAANGETNWERSRRERVAEMAPSIARKAPGVHPTKEIVDVVALQVG